MGSILSLVVLDRLGMDFALTLGGSEFDFASSDYIVIPAVIVSVSLMVVVSLLTPPSPEEQWKPFIDQD
jgi:SSS family solute:Na+ symporter/sodium/proline symporter